MLHSLNFLLIIVWIVKKYIVKYDNIRGRKIIYKKKKKKRATRVGALAFTISLCKVQLGSNFVV